MTGDDPVAPSGKRYRGAASGGMVLTGSQNSLDFNGANLYLFFSSRMNRRGSAVPEMEIDIKKTINGVHPCRLKT